MRLSGSRPSVVLIAALGFWAGSLSAQEGRYDGSTPAFSGESDSSSGALEEAAPEGILSLALDPLNLGTLYAGTRGWGLIKSIDRGRTWSNAGPELSGQSVTAVAVHPNGRVVYAGTETRGIFVSVNAGFGFESRASGLPDPDIRDLVIHPFTPLTLFAGTAAGLAWSQDGGRRWEAFPGGGPREVVDVELSVFRRAGNVAIDTARGRGDEIAGLQEELDLERSTPNVLYVSGDESLWGCDFQPRCRPLLQPADMRSLALQAAEGNSAAVAHLFSVPQDLRIAVSPSHPEVVYVAAPSGLYRSRDRGRTWVGFFSLQGIRTLGVHPEEPGFLWAGTDRGLWTSLDGGQTFAQQVEGAELRLTVLVMSSELPGDLFAGSEDGRLLAQESGAVRIVSLRSQQVTSGDPDSSGSLRGPRLSRIPARPGGQSFFGPHVNQSVDTLAFDPRFAHILYAGTRYGVYRSVDQGTTWQPRTQGMGTPQVLDLVIDPADSYSRQPEEEAVLLAGTNGSGLFRSGNSGQSWSRIEGAVSSAVVRALAFDSADSDLVFAGTRRRGIFRSTDRGLTWRRATVSPRLGPQEPPLGIRDLMDSGGRWLAAADRGRVFESVDRGETWQLLGSLRITGHRSLNSLGRLGLDPASPHVNTLLAHPQREELLHAGTVFGIFRSEDRGKSWRRVLAWHNVVDLAQHPTHTEALVAGTAQGILQSLDGGETWRVLGADDPINSVVFDPIFSSSAFAGNDHGEVLLVNPDEPARRQRLTQPKIVPDPGQKAVPLTDEPRLEAPWDDPRRELRRQLLTWVARANDDELGMEDPRALVLLLLESYLRGETVLSENGGVGIGQVNGRLVEWLSTLQEEYVQHWGVRALSLDPTSRHLAVEYLWDDGARTRSEVRIFDLYAQGLQLRRNFARVGATEFWKELHDRFRRPASAQPKWILKGAGRFLGWSVDGNKWITQNAWDQLTVWADSNGSAVPQVLRGFSHPVRAASLSAGGDLLGIVGTDGRPLWIDLRSGARRLLSRDVPDSGISEVATTENGLFTVGRDGSLRHWTLDGESRLIYQEATGFDHVERSPDGRWWLLGRNNERPSEPEDGLWGHSFLVDLTAPQPSIVSLGRGHLWSGRRWSPDGRWLAMIHGTRGESLLVDLDPSGNVESPAVHRIGWAHYLRFDPHLPILATSTVQLWLDRYPEIYAERPLPFPASQLVAASWGQLWRSFGLRAPLGSKHGSVSALKAPDAGLGNSKRASRGRHPFVADFHTVDGKWVLALDAQGNLAVSKAGDRPPLPTEDGRYPLTPFVGSQWLNLQLTHSPGPTPFPGREWPRLLAAETSRSSVGFGSLLTWGCTIADRNLTPREWQRFFGDETYGETCRFKQEE